MDDKKIHKGKLQVQQSRGNVNYTIRSTSEQIEAIRFNNDKKQKESRMHEEQRRMERYNEIQNEAIQSGKKNAALELKWAESKEIEECEELNGAIETNKDIFKKIIEGKDKLINEFLEELRKKDNEYVKMIKDQSSDIKTMIVQMRSQFFDLRERIMLELEEIENEFNAERQALLNNQQNEIKSLFDKHTEMEKRFVEERDEREEEFTRKIEKLRIDGAKSYTELKISMETEIQNLEKCFEDMKALYQLNTEKLDYNLKVLKEKQEENTHLHDELKRKDQNLNNRLRKLTKDYIDFDKKFKQQNKLYTSEYKRITRQFKELQKKFKHFEKADLERYTEIQKMNEAEVQKLKEKIIKCDMTIHIQQLGMQWEEPLSDEQKEQQSQEKSKLQQTLKNDQSKKAGDEPQIPVSEERLQELIIKTLEEADFLVDDKMRETISELQISEQLQVKLEVLKKCINIESIEEMIVFIEQLVYYTRVKSPEEEVPMIVSEENPENNQQAQQQQQQQQQPAKDSNAKESKKEGKDVKENKKESKDQKEKDKQQQPTEVKDQAPEQDILDLESTPINRNKIVEFLAHWMETAEERKTQIEKMFTKKSAQQESERQKKERIAREGKKYWEKLTQVLPERNFNIWRILDKVLTKYYELLLQRQKLIEETGQLHNQNEELKNLMNQYLQINHELIIPPTRLIKLEGTNN